MENRQPGEEGVGQQPDQYYGQDQWAYRLAENVNMYQVKLLMNIEPACVTNYLY